MQQQQQMPAHLLIACALYDSATGQYNLPSYYINEHEARRASERFLQDPRNADQLPVTNPEDFKMFVIGTYDKATGRLEPLEAPKHLLSLHEVKSYLARQPKDS